MTCCLARPRRRRLLDTSVAAVNSALQRARATLAAANPAAAASRPLSRGEQLVLDAFVRAWQACDMPALAALLRDDATLSMPPQAIQITGRRAVAGFFATVPAAGRPDLIRLAATRANGHPSLAAYLPDDSTDDCRGYGLMVLKALAWRRTGDVSQSGGSRGGSRLSYQPSPCGLEDEHHSQEDHPRPWLDGYQRTADDHEDQASQQDSGPPACSDGPRD